ncbi:helix-turn-helix domain-containing protein [Marivirga sp.]|uniref:helix-turn-helix domain-containing protein n=1 Tax=Marivirga sp. TaxID=2018662 RepID=UPI002D80D3D0|nr:helix-turn-helix domain-containing protein [Marivirga sp.]HET8858835.1 helix-turn-helix domain-containing protein [Marivirga sp.]
MSLIDSNIKYLRKEKGWTQQDLADELGVKRPQIGSYEEGRADPRIQTLMKLSDLFNVSLDDLLGKDLSSPMVVTKKPTKVLAITVDSQERENIELVPQKASAGYTNGYADPEYLQELPRFQLPNLPRNSTYRAFEISGDSMMPIEPGTIIIGEYVESPELIKNGKTYIIVSEQEGVVYKRVFNYASEKGVLFMVSDNSVYSPYEIAVEGVMEIWEAKAFISTKFPDVKNNDKPPMSLQQLTEIVLEIKDEVTKLKK